MKIFAVDDEPKALNILRRAILEAAPEAEVKAFHLADEVLTAVEAGDSPDVLFTDANMPGMDGVELAKRLKQYCPNLNVVFVTGYDEYEHDALLLRVSGYVKKPVTAEDIRAELDDLRHPVAPSSKRVRFQTFGNFEVFIDGKIVGFTREKTKEVLAYLVDRGALCTGAEIAATLWANNVTPSYLRHLRKDLLDTFVKAGCGNVLIREWKKLGIQTELVDCDYYDWKRGLPYAINAYHGEYMAQYSWAEMTHSALEADRSK